MGCYDGGGMFQSTDLMFSTLLTLRTGTIELPRYYEGFWKQTEEFPLRSLIFPIG